MFVSREILVMYTCMLFLLCLTIDVGNYSGASDEDFSNEIVVEMRSSNNYD
jgi:hypothetical protein